MSKQKNTNTDQDIAQMVKHSAHQIWLAGLGAFVKSQQEQNQLFDDLVVEGEAVEKRCREDKHNCARHLPSKPQSSWDKIEHSFEKRVTKTVESLNMPSRKEIDDLQAQIDLLTQRIGSSS